MKFSYEGHTKSGVTKEGLVEADSMEDASAKLRERGVFAMSIVPATGKHKKVLEHGKVPEERDDYLLDLDPDDPDEAPEATEEPPEGEAEDELRSEYDLSELKRVPEEKRHRPKGKRGPGFTADTTLGAISRAMRTAGIVWDSELNACLFERITFDEEGKQVSQWLPEAAWKAYRLEDARAAHQLSQLVKKIT